MTPTVLKRVAIAAFIVLVILWIQQNKINSLKKQLKSEE